MPRLFFADFGNNSGTKIPGEPFPYLALDVVYIPVKSGDSIHARPGDYWVARADNRRILGSLERRRNHSGKPVGDGWEVWPWYEAFQGDHFDDLGDVCDEVPDYLDHSPRVGYTALAYARHRDDAASELLDYLYKKLAPALGFGRHGDVKYYDRPWRKAAKGAEATPVSGPFPTAPGENIWEHIVLDGARPLRFDNLAKEA